MIREHLRELHHGLDRRPISVRVLVTVAALLSLPLLGTGARRLGKALGLDQLVLPLLVVAHVPAVIAIIAVWSIGCEVCRSDDPS